MSSQNRFLLPQQQHQNSHRNNEANSGVTPTSSTSSRNASDQAENIDNVSNQLSVDTDFDSYWEEEARNPHRNRIRIGRQYQASVPPLLKACEKDGRKLEELETLSFCPKSSAKVSSAELDHYFTIAKSLNLFASLVETRSLLGRDVTIADLNHIRNKEGLSLASVIQPVRQTAITSTSTSSVSPQSLQQPSSSASIPLSAAAATQSNANNDLPSSSGQQSPQISNNYESSNQASTCASSKNQQLASIENASLNHPLMKALSHFISLHHPCHHDRGCKKLSKDLPIVDDPVPSVSITAGNLRQGSAGAKASRSRSSLKQALQQPVPNLNKDENEQQDDRQAAGDDTANSPSYEEWTRSELELFAKAIEHCGKNFSSIKKTFLPTKSVKSIVEFYYIGSRDVSDTKKKSSQPVDMSDGCSSPEKSTANNNSHGGDGGGPSPTCKGGASSSQPTTTGGAPSTTSSSRSSNNNCGKTNKSLSETNESDSRNIMNYSEPFSPTCNQRMTSSGRQQQQSQFKSEPLELNGFKNSKTSAIDARMSVYNFDEEFKDDSPVKFDSPRPGAEVRPLKAKPIVPNASLDSDATNSNVGSLKFFMDGQLVLKLNACQEQQGEGVEKCHWVQSGDKMANSHRSKRYSKRSSDRTPTDHNGSSQTNSVISTNQDEDSKTEDITGDEDSKESMGSLANSAAAHQQQKNHSGYPTSKRLKIKGEQQITNNMQQSQQLSQLQQQQHQLSSPINYNRLAVNNLMKERSNESSNQNQAINQATMPWLQANSLAVAAALLGGLPFPQQAMPNNNNITSNSNNIGHLNNNTLPSMQAQINSNNAMATAVNVVTSNPMDLSITHGSPRAIQQKPSNRSRSSRPKNSN